MTTPDQPRGINPGSTTRGRPRSSGGQTCARCRRHVAKIRTRWPEGAICGICFHNAARTYGTCPGCGAYRLLPGPPDINGRPSCVECAGLDDDFCCTRCGQEGEFYRRGLCARCALRDDLTAMLLTPASTSNGAADSTAMATLVKALCASQRPESIFVWKRNSTVQKLLTGLADGSVPRSHEGLDAFGREPPSTTCEPSCSITGYSPPATRSWPGSKPGSPTSWQKSPNGSPSRSITSLPGITSDESGPKLPPANPHKPHRGGLTTFLSWNVHARQAGYSTTQHNRTAQAAKRTT